MSGWGCEPNLKIKNLQVARKAEKKKKKAEKKSSLKKSFMRALRARRDLEKAGLLKVPEAIGAVTPTGAETPRGDDEELLEDEPNARGGAEAAQEEPEPHPEEDEVELWPAAGEKFSVGVEDLMHATRLGENGESEGLSCSQCAVGVRLFSLGRCGCGRWVWVREAREVWVLV